jgi:hypothetical protein
VGVNSGCNPADTTITHSDSQRQVGPKIS